MALEMSGDFFVTLPSDASMERYPDNTMAGYTTALHAPIHLTGDADDWEVSLCQLIFPQQVDQISTPEDGWWYWTQSKGAPPSVLPLPFQSAAGSNNNNSLAPHFQWHRANVPAGNYASPQVLIDALNQSVTAPSPILPPVVFSLQPGTGKLAITLRAAVDGVVVKVAFSPRLVEMLGLPSSEHLTVSTQHEPLVGAKPVQCSSTAAASLMMVYADCCQPGLVGEQQVPLLRVIAPRFPSRARGTSDACGVANASEHQFWEFASLHYQPVRHRLMQRIRLTINSTDGSPYPFTSGYGRVIATLHFRTKRHRLLLSA